jgi:ribosomal protein L15
MTRKYVCTRSRSRRNKRSNKTRKHHGGRGGAGGVAGAGHYGSATTTGASQVYAQWTGQTPGLSSGGKRGAPIASPLRKTHRSRRSHTY